MELPLPSDDEIRELARRMGGGHPIADVRAEEHVAIHNTPVEIPPLETTSTEVSVVEETTVTELTEQEDEADGNAGLRPQPTSD